MSCDGVVGILTFGGDGRPCSNHRCEEEVMLFDFLARGRRFLAAAGFAVLAFSFSGSGQAQDQGLSVMTVNMNGLNTIEGIDWKSRIQHLTSWGQQNSAVPDVIALTELHA
jgi:hypothetical protein